MSGFYCKALIGKILVLWIGDHLWEVVANGDSTVYLYILCGLKISLSTILFRFCGNKLSRIWILGTMGP